VVNVAHAEEFKHDTEYQNYNLDAFIVGLKIGIALFFIGAILIISAMTGLIVAIIKGTPGGAMVWLVITMIDFVFRGIQLFIAFFATHALIFLIALPVFGFGIYLWIVVLSFYHELRNNALQPQQQIAAYSNAGTVYPGQQMQYGQQPQQMQYGVQPQQMQYGQQLQQVQYAQPVGQYPQQPPFQQHQMHAGSNC